jgi:hypothetical protein
MTRFNSHLIKSLVELVSYLCVLLFLILCENANPWLEDDLRKQGQACNAVYLINKLVCISWIINVHIGHDADVLQYSD